MDVLPGILKVSAQKIGVYEEDIELRDDVEQRNILAKGIAEKTTKETSDRNTRIEEWYRNYADADADTSNEPKERKLKFLTDLDSPIDLRQDGFIIGGGKLIFDQNEKVVIQERVNQDTQDLGMRMIFETEFESGDAQLITPFVTSKRKYIAHLKYLGASISHEPCEQTKSA